MPFLRGMAIGILLIFIAFFLKGKAKIYQFLRVCVHRHFDLFFLGVHILLNLFSWGFIFYFF